MVTCRKEICKLQVFVVAPNRTNNLSRETAVGDYG